MSPSLPPPPLPLPPQVRSPILQAQPRLPTPLGSFLYTAPYFTSLPLADRLTALPLLGPLLEYGSDSTAYGAYDKMSALELFRCDCRTGTPRAAPGGCGPGRRFPRSAGCPSAVKPSRVW